MFNKRYQVLLNDWMEEYFQSRAERYDLNMSSVLRSYLCLGIIYNVSILFPEFKTDLDSKETVESMKKLTEDKLAEEGIYKSMSKILFEARKATEYRYAKETKKKKK